MGEWAGLRCGDVRSVPARRWRRWRRNRWAERGGWRQRASSRRGALARRWRTWRGSAGLSGGFGVAGRASSRCGVLARRWRTWRGSAGLTCALRGGLRRGEAPPVPGGALAEAAEVAAEALGSAARGQTLPRSEAVCGLRGVGGGAGGAGASCGRGAAGWASVGRALWWAVALAAVSANLSGGHGTAGWLPRDAGAVGEWRGVGRGAARLARWSPELAWPLVCRVRAVAGSRCVTGGVELPGVRAGGTTGRHTDRSGADRPARPGGRSVRQPVPRELDLP
jgi:hypothetical protein